MVNDLTFDIEWKADPIPKARLTAKPLSLKEIILMNQKRKKENRFMRFLSDLYCCRKYREYQED